MRRTDSAPDTWAAVVALLLAAAASAFVLFVPTSSSERSAGSGELCGQPPEPGVTSRCPPHAVSVSVSETLTADGNYVVRETVTFRSGRTRVREHTRPADVERTTLLEEQPEAIIPLVAIAIGIAGFPLLLGGSALRRPSRVVAASVLLVGSLLAVFSVGLCYLPSAAAMAVAAARA